MGAGVGACGGELADPAPPVTGGSAWGDDPAPWVLRPGPARDVRLWVPRRAGRTVAAQRGRVLALDPEEAPVDVRDAMSSPAISLKADVPAKIAAALLVSHGYTAAPVVDEDERVIGIATEADLVRAASRPRAGRWRSSRSRGCATS